MCSSATLTLLGSATNENTNGLLRQYFPKGFDFSTVTEAHLDAVADELNARPRKRFDFANPDRAALRTAVAITASIRRSGYGTLVRRAARADHPSPLSSSPMGAARPPAATSRL